MTKIERHAVALALFLLLVVAPQPVPSDIAEPDSRLPLPPAEESLAREDLAAWLAEGATTDLRVVSPGDLSAALGSTPRRFSLFAEPGPASLAAQRDVLCKLPYGRMMAKTAERNRVDGLLLAAVVEAESGFIPNAVSPSGAEGLMQILPSTGADYGASNLLDPSINLDAGCRYLGGLLERFGHRPELAVAAYNAGPEVVLRFGGVPPYRETRDFVKRVLTRYAEHQRKVAGRSLALVARGPAVQRGSAGEGRSERGR
jgi:soluble lytic murein transglycosylase-like protein